MTQSLFTVPDGSSDYVEEGDDRVCEQCGGTEVREGECKECGWKGGQVMETKRRSSSKHSDGDIDNLIKDLRYDLQHDDEEEEDEVEFELEIDEEEHCEQCGRKPMEEKLYGGQKKLDKNRNGRLDREDFKMLRKQQDEEQLYEIEFTKTETDEGNAFTGPSTRLQMVMRILLKLMVKNITLKDQNTGWMKNGKVMLK